MNEVRTAESEANLGPQLSLQTVYLKDCSYESPNGPRLPTNQAWEPKFQLNMNTSAEELSPELIIGGFPMICVFPVQMGI